MKLRLSTYDVNDFTKKLRFLESDIEDASIEIVNELVDEGTFIAKQLNASAPKSGLVDNDIIPVHSKVSENGKAKGSITMQGENAVYDEFGTGDQGAENPHPAKGKFGLNPYNSGPTIFYNQFAGRNQWYYKPMAGRPYFTEYGATEGIPAGKQMYTTAKMLKKKKKKIAKAIVRDMLRKYK